MIETNPTLPDMMAAFSIHRHRIYFATLVGSPNLAHLLRQLENARRLAKAGRTRAAYVMLRGEWS